MDGIRGEQDGKEQSYIHCIHAMTPQTTTISSKYLVVSFGLSSYYGNTLPKSSIASMMSTRFTVGPDLEIIQGVDKLIT